MWKHILRDQLGVSEKEFWDCLESGTAPSRGAPEVPVREPIPTGVVSNLITRVGLSEEEVAAMDRDEAIERLNQFWITGE